MAARIHSWPSPPPPAEQPNDETVELIDDDPPPGDFNDAASLAIASLAELLGHEEPGEIPVPRVLRQVRIRLTRLERRSAILLQLRDRLDGGDVVGARALVEEAICG